MSRSQPWSVGLSIQDRVMDIVRAALTCSLNWELRKEEGAKAYTSSVPDQLSVYPGGLHTVVFYTMCVTPVGWLGLIVHCLTVKLKLPFWFFLQGPP